MIKFSGGRKEGLLEGMIRGEGVANAQLVHCYKGDAIGERPFLVRVFAEQSGGGMQSLRTDPFQPE